MLKIDCQRQKLGEISEFKYLHEYRGNFVMAGT